MSTEKTTTAAVPVETLERIHDRLHLMATTMVTNFCDMAAELQGQKALITAIAVLLGRELMARLPSEHAPMDCQRRHLNLLVEPKVIPNGKSRNSFIYLRRHRDKGHLTKFQRFLETGDRFFINQVLFVRRDIERKRGEDAARLATACRSGAYL